ncbi:hypothetical protein OW666_11450 [Acinetobacter baumannii]|uniref:hypothetical protein n=1 Tax=Acinetobacter baumannii TaxID=470 RepID=UPI0024DED747|nr:hypothetical protein [Acinetobacter baumannii]MDK2129583.1 hypothetical protein [Acinetobacter baumannii]MDK2160213.1 hypothetical protein [Acinetobacter baumannii]MDK2167672.1 hypothetical protein [Acinetobacter baumannii]MDK2251249.1 hypothetical protein [Acinetobacter baumannii]MDK2262454.1 hypothetical protein [Acinetobacter baumannii]
MAQQIVIEVPGTKISELEKTTSVSRGDVTPVVQGEETKQADIGQIADFVKSELGSASTKDASEFATPTDVSSVAIASQQRDDAQNERLDNVEYGLIAIGNGADKSFSTYAEMIAYVPDQANVSVRNNDPDPELRGTYIWTGTEYVAGYDPLDAANKYSDKGIKTFVSDQSYVGPVQVEFAGIIWELPAGQSSNGSTQEAPYYDARWIQKIHSETNVKLDKAFKPYVVIDGVVSEDINNRHSKLLDRAIKKLSIIGKNVDRFKFIHLKTFNIKVSASTVSFSCTLTLLDSMSESATEKDIELNVLINKPSDSNGVFTAYSKATDTQMELILDTNQFLLDVQYQYSATLKENGLLNYDTINIVTNKYFGANIVGNANTYRGDSFALARGLKDITAKGDFNNRELHFVSLEKTATQVIVDFKVSDKKTGANIAYRQRVPNTEFVGVLNLGLFAFSGANYRTVNCGVAVTLDADYLNTHYQDQGVATWKISAIDANQPLLNKSKLTEIRALDQYDFSQPGYADYRGMWYATSTYRRMAVGIKIPDGATAIKAIGGFDKNANILFGDVNGQLINSGFAWKNVDGTKYSGDEVKTSLDADIPVGAKYLHMSTTLATVASATLNFVGDFEYAKKTDFESIQSAILDKTVQDGVYTAGKYLFRKNGSDINTVEVIDSSNLALADTYTASTLKQGASQGQLAFYKNGKYYYYHGSNREIYVEENGVKTALTSPALHPTSWALSIAQQQQRTVIEVLEDESILFSMKETQVDGNITYSLWKMEVGQEPVRCFMYSNDFFTKPDTSVQSANGCPLGEWSFAYAEGLIFATEYGEGTSKWWSDQSLSGGNGKGVSSRVWVSNDNGDTWYICLNLNELKNTAEPISDSNWKYFTDTNAKNYCHIHMIKYDNYDKRIYVSNGDGENYLWSIGLDSIKTWLASAVAVNPTALPIYTQVTGLTWNAVRLCTYQNQPNINYHNMKFQMTALYPVEQGLLMGHDAPRDFMYMAHRKGILSQSTFRFEPTYNYERSTDFDFDYEFKASQDSTDGFVQVMTRNKKTDPILVFVSASGKFCRIWATYNGINHKAVFESCTKEIQFGCRTFFDDKGNVILSTGAGITSANSGYYLLSTNKV